MGKNFAVRKTQAVFLCAALFVLAGCSEDGKFSLDALKKKPDATEAATETPTGKGTERDVEAPEVFEAAEAGLWDGRPSLGGVWVAHPDVVEPERVIIRNTANDKSVVGALFRRDQDWAVYTTRDGRAKLTSVKLGKFSLTHSEVLAGVTREDLVVMFPSDKVSDKTAVKQR